MYPFWNIAKFLLLLPLLCAALQTKAQIPATFPDSAASWNVYFYISPDPFLPIQEYYFRYYLDGDTLLGGQNYAKVYEAPTNAMLIDTANATYVGGLREDSARKVWFYGPGPQFYEPYCDYPPDTTEQLLYDFGLEVGDTAFMGSPSLPYYTCLGVDTININGTLRRRLDMTAANCSGCEYWVEGVGSSKGLFYPWCELFEWDWELICFEDPDIFYNASPSITNCYTIASLDDPLVQQVQLWPNPAQEALSISLHESMQGLFQLEVFDVRGQRVLQRELEAGLRVDWNVGVMPRGLYAYRLSQAQQLRAAGKFLLD